MRALILVLLFACNAIGEETAFDSIAQRELRSIDGKIEEARKQLEFIRSKKAKYDPDLGQAKYDEESDTMWFVSRKQRSEEIKSLEDKLIAIKRKKWDGDFGKTPYLEYKDFKAGAMGMPVVMEKSFPAPSLSSGPVVAGSVAGANLTAYASSPEVACGISALVIQVWDNNEVLAALSFPSVNPGQGTLENAIVTHVDPKDQRDRNRIDLSFVQIVGTRDYQSITGKRTIFEISVDPKLADKYRDALQALKLPEKAMRTWSDATGEFSVEAKLIDYKMNKVYLEKADGAGIELFISKLSDADKNFVEVALGTK